MPQIQPVLFMVVGKAPLFRKTLVKGLGTVFCSHTYQKDLLRCESACCHTPETKRIREKGRERERRDRHEFRSCGCCTVLSSEANEYDKFLPTQFPDKLKSPTNKWLSFSVP